MATENLQRFYLYLAKRDKKGIRLVAILQSRNVLPVKIPDLAALNLPASVHTEIAQIIQESRLNWELWAETAESFVAWRAALKKRGYSNIPLSERTEYTGSTYILPDISRNSLPSQKVMVQRRTN